MVRCQKHKLNLRPPFKNANIGSAKIQYTFVYSRYFLVGVFYICNGVRCFNYVIYYKVSFIREEGNIFRKIYYFMCLINTFIHISWRGPLKCNGVNNKRKCFLLLLFFVAHKSNLFFGEASLCFGARVKM